jgi:GNAT superfamily N-acetyltransferase
MVEGPHRSTESAVGSLHRLRRSLSPSRGGFVSHDAIANDQLAAVVTYLEMHQPPSGEVPPSPLSLRRRDRLLIEDYRRLFRLVGAPWLWFSRLIMDESKLAAIIHHPKVELYTVVDENGSDRGILELDLREPGECELAFVGLVEELSGQGHGRWLLAEALRLAWRERVSRVHVHTCTLDHPAALAAYRRAGFVACKRAVETFPDPRLLGILPLDCAPQLPLLGTETSMEPRPESCT